MAPTLVASRTALPPEGAAAPAARQSRFRGPCWNGKGPGSHNSCRLLPLYYSLSLRERAG